jgi:hypothetical protein
MQLTIHIYSLKWSGLYYGIIWLKNEMATNFCGSLISNKKLICLAHKQTDRQIDDLKNCTRTS